ncbi:MAG: response regulator, partial [Myxococcota bacterium]|nr:response regulator [Myxococcota bacterium]
QTSDSEQGAHVLLVDDNPANIGHVRDFLTTKGHTVTVAHSGEEALQLAQALPDIVFMDIQMPGMTGIEAIRHLRSDEHTRHLHIIALTAQAMGEDRERCLDAGADDHVTKPVSLRSLLAIVERREPPTN